LHLPSYTSLRKIPFLRLMFCQDCLAQAWLLPKMPARPTQAQGRCHQPSPSLASDAQSSAGLKLQNRIVLWPPLSRLPSWVNLSITCQQPGAWTARMLRDTGAVEGGWEELW
jgi:hypothetical protein